MGIRKARQDDALDLAQLIDLAGEGIPGYLWGEMKSSKQTVLEFGAVRAAREEGGFSYTHAWVLEQNDIVVGMLLGYSQPDPYDLTNIDEYPEVVQPIVKLESLAPGSWYINGLAIKAQYRRQGLASTLLDYAEQIAALEGYGSLSLIVSSENTQAKNLYEKKGYQAKATTPEVSFAGRDALGDWVLMVKKLSH